MRKPEVDIKAVPESQSERELIRVEAQKAGSGFNGMSRLNKEYLDKTARIILKTTGLGEKYLGYAMVSLNNEFWRKRYSVIPNKRRLLLLPHCLRNRKKCRGKIDRSGALLCAECGCCKIAEIKIEAKKRGYDLLLAEGSPVVLEKILKNDVDSILGVACLDSFEKVFPNASRLGIPNIAVPLLKDGCINTVMDAKELSKWFLMNGGVKTLPGRYSLLPLARLAYSLFEPDNLNKLAGFKGGTSRKTKEVKNLALEWIEKEGKRLRTIFTLASYSALKYGLKAFQMKNTKVKNIPEMVKKTALAIEVLHKASLVHDDIEDNDTVRYKEETMNKKYGVPVALNAGDYLIGLGYKMISSEKKTMGSEAVADILNGISSTYLKMSEGQGKELFGREKDLCSASLKEVLDIYKLKTSSAFGIALYCGLRAATRQIKEHNHIEEFSENLGIAFQIHDDINEWKGVKRKKSDFKVVLRTPDALKALARKKGLAPVIKNISNLRASEKKRKDNIRRLYEENGIFEAAGKMAEIYKEKSLAAAGKVKNPALKEALILLTSLTFKE